MKLLLLLCITTFTFAGYGASENLIHQGDVYDQQFKPDQALEYYLPAEKQAPNDASLLVKIARQYVFRMDELTSKTAQMDSAEKALAYAQRAVKVAPNSSDAHLSIAIVYGKMTPLMGNKEKIEASKKIKESTEQAIKLNPRDDYAWHFLGRWHQALAGMSGFTRGIARLVYGSLPEASNVEAVKNFEKAIALNPNRLIHYIELGRTYAQMGKTEEAKTFINKGLAMPNKEKDDADTKRRGRETLSQL